MIKYGSNTHHMLLMLQSNRGTPKTTATLSFISNKPRWLITRGLKSLTDKGLVTQVKEDTYKVTAQGTDTLRSIAGEGDARNMKDDDEMVERYYAMLERGKERKRN